MQKITSFLWYDGTAVEAAKLYTSVFKNSKILTKMEWGEGAPAPKGSLMSVNIEIEGQEFILFNGGPMFKFTPAISLFVKCESQEEIDHYWSKLTEGGREDMCGWMVDRFGVSWQIVPPMLVEMLTDKDPVKSKRTMEAMLQMRKLDISKLREAYNGKA